MVTSQGSYSTLDKIHLSNVTNVANVQIGSLDKMCFFDIEFQCNA